MWNVSHRTLESQHRSSHSRRELYQKLQQFSISRRASLRCPYLSQPKLLLHSMRHVYILHQSSSHMLYICCQILQHMNKIIANKCFLVYRETFQRVWLSSCRFYHSSLWWGCVHCICRHQCVSSPPQLCKQAAVYLTRAVYTYSTDNHKEPYLKCPKKSSLIRTVIRNFKYMLYRNTGEVLIWCLPFLTFAWR